MEGPVLGTPLIVIGAIVLLFGLLFMSGAGRHIGRLPGDVSAQRGPVRFYAPMGTSLLVSVVLSVVLSLFMCGLPR